MLEVVFYKRFCRYKIYYCGQLQFLSEYAACEKWRTILSYLLQKFCEVMI